MTVPGLAALVASAAATWAMVGLIWVIQLVHYPMLVGWSTTDPIGAAAFHQRRISFVVGPLMAVEGVTALALLVSRPPTMSAVAAWVAAALLAVALASTVLIQVPLHTRLAAGIDEDAAQRLCSTNWIRTVAWTLRGLVLAAVLVL